MYVSLHSGITCEFSSKQHGDAFVPIHNILGSVPWEVFLPTECWGLRREDNGRIFSDSVSVYTFIEGLGYFPCSISAMDVFHSFIGVGSLERLESYSF